MIVAEAHSEARGRLEEHQVPDAGLEAELLLRHALATDRAGYFMSVNNTLTTSQRERVDLLTLRRTAGESLAYILGHREFYGLDFIVSPAVLVPRQETELLVDKVREFATARRGERVAIADIGTGCGAIAIAVAHHLSEATVYATDLSREALAVAAANRSKHGLSGRVRLAHGDLLAPLPAAVRVIVTNPPYIRTARIPELSREVRGEPLLALDGGEDGLGLIRRLFQQAPDRVQSGGALFVEIDPGQVEDVMQIGREAFPAASVSFSHDLLGLPRVVSVLLA